MHRGTSLFRPALRAALSLALCALPLAGLAQGRTDHPFNGQNLTGWKTKEPAARSAWVVADAAMDLDNNAQLALLGPVPPAQAALVNARGGGVDIYTEQKWGDHTIDLELMVPKGSNSGVYVMGEYEVQVLDSYGKANVGPGDIGGLYGAQAPRVNASKAPGEWQHFVIEFQAPRFQGTQKTANAKFVKVTLNGQVIHENVEMKGPTPSGVTGKEAPTGPLMFQGDHGPVAYRNIKVITR
jgi:hypothetical protein